MTATSVGITARVLADLGRLQDAAAEVVLGAAVVDDILGLIFAGAGLVAGVIAQELYSALVVAVMITTFAAPPWLKALCRDRTRADRATRS